MPARKMIKALHDTTIGLTTPVLETGKVVAFVINRDDPRRGQDSFILSRTSAKELHAWLTDYLTEL